MNGQLMPGVWSQADLGSSLGSSKLALVPAQVASPL